MNAPTSSSAPAEKLLSSVEAEISRLLAQKAPNPPTQIEADAERIKAAIARLTSNSIDGLEGLMSELQQLQAFLKCEVELQLSAWMSHPICFARLPPPPRQRTAATLRTSPVLCSITPIRV
jgi:hypothetical protein